ncbi:hypothetical protein M4I32_08225 [Microbacterium sp. LRZ72]|nr:hypothetical protein [Microbacterium sp. LRZ72]MDX2376783.1 hypothetical protein [Microbacterium sp. LRZ72]
MDPFDHDAQPICPACGVTTQPGEGADECWECGYLIESDAGEDPDHG